MRSWKVAFAAIAVAVIVIAFLVLRRGDALIGGTAGAATPNPATIAMPVPVTKIVKKAVPIYLDYSARTESIRNIALQAKVSGYIRQQHVPELRHQEGDCFTRSIRATSRPRWIKRRRRRNATRPLSTMRTPISTAGRRLPKAATSPRTPSTSAPVPRSRPRPRWRWIRPPSGRPSSTSATRKSARHSPDVSVGTKLRSAPLSASPAPLNTLVQQSSTSIQPERDGPRRDPEGARRREGRSRHPSAGRDAGAPRRRADFHRQCGRSLNWHHRRARDHRQL